MARIWVSAYFLDDAARNTALEVMGPKAHATEGFVYGEVEEADVPKLEDAGIIVQPYLPGRRVVPRAPLKPSVVASRGGEETALDTDAFPAVVDYYALQLQGPLIEPWRKALADLGVKLLEALPTGGYKVRLSMDVHEKVKALDFVESVDWIPPSRSAPVVATESLAPAFGLAPPSGLKMLTFDVRLHLPEDRPKIEQWLRDNKLDISGSSGRKVRFFALENAPQLDQLAALPEVDTIAEYVEPKLSNDIARVVLGVDAPLGNNPSTFIREDGSGQIVGVADTGIDDQHLDFQGRIIGKVARGRPNDTTDPHGHGTHVSGSVLGDGSASGGRIRGIAPKAQLFFQSLLDANGKLGGLPVDLNDLFDEAYQAGVRIHNNSWGADTGSVYTMNSEEVDEFVCSHPDMLILIAAGNAGTAAKPANAASGFVDWLSIGSPASSKNALTVGASRSNRTDGPMAQITWHSGWPASFPDAPIANEFVSGDAERLAAFSSRGPCDDFRIKPDVVAPGTDIASTRSSLAPSSHFWGPYPTPPAQPPNPKYAYDGGTSMATPLVAGCAALVRQYYIQQRNHQPSAALLKATLINSARWLSGPDSTAPKNGTPNYHQGHGRVSMGRAIPNDSAPNLQLQFVDEWQNPNKSLARTGDRQRLQFALPQGVPEIRICLAYTDVPARALQNNLNLIVQHIQSGQRWTGNSGLPDGITRLDTTNNVERVLIANPQPGNYVVQIVASNLLKPPQDFALVVTGDHLPVLDSI
jgi:hypothetical protein